MNRLPPSVVAALLLAGCRGVGTALPPYEVRVAAIGPSHAVAFSRDGHIYSVAASRLWRTAPEASESWTPETGWTLESSATASVPVGGAEGLNRLLARRGIRDGVALAIGPSGALAVADRLANRVWEVATTRSASPALRPLAGTGTTFYPIGDGALAVGAQLDGPRGVAWLPEGTLLIADTGHGRVRKVGLDGRIASLAGTSIPGSPGDGGPAARAWLSLPSALAIGAQGTILVADPGDQRIRAIAPDLKISTLATLVARGVAVDQAGVVFASAGTTIQAIVDGQLQEIASGLHDPAGLDVDKDGTIAVADKDRIVLLVPRGK